MNRILEKKKLSDEVYQIKVSSPLIASARKPGQFIILQTSDDAERIPLTIADADDSEGSIILIFQTVGKSTHVLAGLNEGDIIPHLVGPLGRPTHIEKFGRVVCVGGGVGVAPLYPIAKGMKDAGNDVTVILGARNRDLVIFEDRMKAISEKVIICTDDGSYGLKGVVTVPLKELCEKEPRPDMVVAIGPPIMMKFCAETTRPFQIPTLVSLNTIMIDGTGMCGSCRITVGGKTKFVCVDGPEFDGHKVDFDNVIQRLGSYRDFEKKAHDQCHLDLKIKKLEDESR